MTEKSTPQIRPIVLVVSAPSGGGKTTIVNQVLDKVTGIKRTVSYTTRKPRRGEKTKEDYIFVTKEDFQEKIEKEALLEWEKNFGNYYGTSEEQVRKIVGEGNDVILNIDVKGARRVKKIFPDCVRVFILPPSIEELEKRLSKRKTEKKEQMDRRISEAKNEMTAASEYEYTVVNETLDKAVAEVVAIIRKERKIRKT